MRGLVAAALITFLAGGSSSGGGAPIGPPLFAMDCGAAGVDYPECGFEVADNKDGDLYNRSYEATGGPGNGWYILWDFIPGETLDYSAANWGWQSNNTFINAWESGTAVPQGEARYLRYWGKVFTPFSWTNAPGGGNGTKVIDFGQQCEQGGFEPTRVISQLYGAVDGRFDITAYQGGGGGTTIAENGVALDTWIPFQIKMQSSSTTSATDGYIAFYIGADNASEATPTQIYDMMDYQVIKTTGWPGGACTGKANVFGGTIDRISIDSTFTIGLSRYEYDDEFDADWHNP